MTHAENLKKQGYVPLINGAAMRRLKGKDGEKYVQIRFDDESLHVSVHGIIHSFLEQGFFEAHIESLAAKVVSQFQDEKKWKEGAPHLLLTVDEGMSFFSLLSEIGDITREVREEAKQQQQAETV